MNTAMLYNEVHAPGAVAPAKICKLCDQDVDADWHLDDCPGIMIERAEFEITIDGDNCGRGCCGYTHTRVSGPNLEELYGRAWAAASDFDYPGYGLRVVFDLSDIDLKKKINEAGKGITAAREAEEAREAAEERAREMAEAKKRDLERLELERPDLTDAAYTRRKAEIEARV